MIGNKMVEFSNPGPADPYNNAENTYDFTIDPSLIGGGYNPDNVGPNEAVINEVEQDFRNNLLEIRSQLRQQYKEHVETRVESFIKNTDPVIYNNAGGITLGFIIFILSMIRFFTKDVEFVFGT